MAGYGAYTSIQGKTKMDDSTEQYYQQPAKKTKVEYMETGTWQQPDTGAYTTDYSSYYSMYTDPSQQQQQSQQLQTQQIQSHQLQQQQQQQTQPAAVTSYSQSTYDPSQYSSYASYSSYYSQPQETTAAPPATYECPLYDKSGSSYYSNGQQASYSTGYGSVGSGYSQANQARNQGYSYNGNGTTGSGYRGSRNSSDRGSSNRGSTSRGRGIVGSGRGGGAGDPRSIRSTASSGRGMNRGYTDDEMDYSDTMGRFAGYSRNSRGGSLSRGGGLSSTSMGRGGASRGRGRGRGASNNGPEGDMKWETLPGGQSRPKEKKPQAAAKAPTVDASKLPLPEKIRRLSLFLRNEKRDVNEIMLLENSIMSCKLGIKPDFLIDEMIQGKNGSFFTGRLIFDGVFLARHIASNKKVIKLTCYKRAVEMFRSMSVAEIMNQKDITTEELKEKLDNLNSTVAKVEKETIKDLPTVEVLRKLQEILKNPKYTPSNAVSNLEQAAAVAKCRIRCRYDVEQGQSITGRVYFKGSYYIDNVVQGLGFSVSKKTAKANCYNMVVQRLMTCKAEDILNGLDPSIGEKALADLNASMKIVPKSAKNLDLREKFVRLKELLAISDLTPDIITAMDLMFSDVKLTPVCLYRRGPKQENTDSKPILYCNLYLAGRLMAIGEAPNRTEAQIKSYANSKEIILTTEPEVILTQHSKLQAHDQAASDVIDFRVKGNCVLRNNCTNFHRLQRTKLKVSETPVKDIVLYEHASWSSDRKVQGFCILQHSCFLNNMLLEWEFTDDNNSTQFRCDMKIQKENIGTQPAKSVSKIGSRNLAAADILFKLYETRPVIQITTYTKMEESTKCITFDEVLDAAIELHNAAKNAGEEVEMAPQEEQKPAETEVKMEQDIKTEAKMEQDIKTEAKMEQDIKTEAKMEQDIKTEVKTETKDGDVEMKEENPEENKPQRRRRPFKYLSKFILQDVKRRVEEFTKVKSLEDMLFGPSYPSQIGRQIGGILRNSGVPLRYMTRPIRGSMYTIVTQSMTPNEMASFLKENGGSSGRFKLVDKSELPSHNDIMPELTSGEIKVSTNSQPNQDQFFDDVSIESNSEFHTAMSSTLGDNTAYQSTYDTTLTSNSSSNTSLVTPKKEDLSLPSTPMQGNTSTPKQNMTSTPVQKKTPASKKKL